MVIVLALAIAFGWVGHACIWTALLNHLYGRPWHKGFLRVWRSITALILLVYPLIAWVALRGYFRDGTLAFESHYSGWGVAARVYLVICLFLGAGVFPLITLIRLLRPRPSSLLAERTRTLDLWPELGRELIGDNHLAVITRLPGNCVFQVDFTETTLAPANLPPAWDGLTILVVSDLHFQGTPSRAFFERILEELDAETAPDLVCLLGDYLDTAQHLEWIEPLASRFQARECKLAILGNHDLLHQPNRVREDLARAGFIVLGNSWRQITIRGQPCVVTGHEGPWFRPAPELSRAPSEPFRLCLSHTPDNLYWGVANRINLMLCGHVHGGGIRVPVIGPIFIPSVYGRRFDSGVFEKNGTTMVVCRGLSGKEPLRFRCRPQVMRLILKLCER